MESVDELNEKLARARGKHSSCYGNFMESQKIIRRMCDDWAEEHAAAQKIAMQCGVPRAETMGDTYGVPSIIDLMEMAVAKLRAQVVASTNVIYDGDYIIADGSLLIHGRTGRQVVLKQVVEKKSDGWGGE